MKKLISLVILSVLGFIGLASAVSAKDQDDRGPLTKVTFIHYKKDKHEVKPGGSAKPTAPSCYGYLAKGAKWKGAEDYVVNPAGSGVNQSAVLSAMNAGVAEWEKYGGPAIFGNGSTDTNVAFDDTKTDGKNVVVFGEGLASNIIAVTNVWGYFGGPMQTRQLVEWDMKFNTYFTWGDATQSAALMDVQNIATHELGHSAGMDDLYTTSCTLETMYGYSGEGETIKRDLHTGDIVGIQSLYR